MSDISQIYQFGDQYKLNISLDKSIVEDLDFFKDKWCHYNPHTPHIQREGLCVLNERGKVGYEPFKEPSLDSLRRFNNLNGTTWKESDFKKPTELYHHSSALQKLFKDILPYCQRTHFLKLKPGGFFPPHRDHVFGKQETFRLIVPIQNYQPPFSRFMVEERSLYWDKFDMYVVNTTKSHTLVNLSPTKDSIWLVINAEVCNEMINFVENNLTEQ